MPLFPTSFVESSSGDSIRKHAKSLLICSSLATATFQYGFDTGIINGFQATPGFLEVFGVPTATPGVFTIGTVFQQLITSLLQVGLIIGSLCIGPFSRFYGRLPAFFIASCLAIAAITIQIFVTSKAAICVARLLMGTANGFYVNLVVLYISESLPARLRGAGVSAYQPFLNIGTMLSAIISNAFSTNLSKISYRAQLAILYIVPVWLAIFVFFIPESPRWLAVRGNYAGAEESLRRLRGRHVTLEEIKEEMSSIKENIIVENEISKHTNWREMFEGANLRRTLLCAACTTFHGASGINFLVSYATFFFQISGTTKPFVNTIILQTCGFVASLVALPAARKFNRRPMLLTGFSVAAITMFIVALLFTLDPHDPKAAKAMVAMVCLFNVAYGGTIGPIAWVVAGEMPSNRLRSHTFGLAMALGFVFAWLAVFTTPYFLNPSQLNWGPKIGWVWFPSNLITLAFIYLFLPETKGKTLEEIDEIFAKQSLETSSEGFDSKMQQLQ